MEVKIRQAPNEAPAKTSWVSRDIDERHIRPSPDWREIERHCDPGHHPVEIFYR